MRYAADPEKKLAAVLAYRARDPEAAAARIRTAALKWRHAHLDHARQNSLVDYYRKQPHYRAQARQRRAAMSPEDRRAMDAAYRDKYQEQRRRHYQEHKELYYDKAARRRARKANARRVERISWKAIIERDNSTCYLWCKRKLTRHEITFDHVIPLSRGGTHTMDNLRVACLACNLRKAARLLSELDL